MSRTKKDKLEVEQDVSHDGDKRMFRRFELDAVPMRYKDLKIGLKGEAQCVDISGGGAAIRCSRELRPRTPLELWFDLTDGFEPVHLLGKVAWVAGSGADWKAGVAFDRQRLMSLTRLLKMRRSEA